MAENVGSIYYTVEAKTGALIAAEREALESINRTTEGIKKAGAESESATPKMKKSAEAIKGMGQSADQASKAVSTLTGYLKGLMAIGTAAKMLDLVEGYNEMADRVQLATASLEEYDYVQQRVLATANATERNLSEAQELYLGTEAVLRDYGYSLSEILDINDSLSHSFAANATSAQAANSAIVSLSKALVRGRVDAIQWVSITAAAPTIVDDLAKSTGKTAQEIRRLGADGKIAARDLAQALQESLDKNRELDESMSKTVAGSFKAVVNSMAVYFGELNRSSGATAMMSDALRVLADNIDTVANVAFVGLSAAAGRYIGVTAASIASSIKATIQSHAAAAAALKKAQADEAAALAALKQAKANATLGGSLSEVTRKTKEYEAAKKAATVAQSNFISIGSRLLGVLGGPAGIAAMIASTAGSMLLLKKNTKEAREEVDLLAISVESLGEANLRLTKTKVLDKIEEMESLGGEAAKAGARIQYLRGQLIQFPKSKEAANWRKEIVELEAKVETANETLSAHQELLNRIKQIEEERAAARKAGVDNRDPEAERRLRELRDELELVKLQGEARARLQAIQKLGDKATPEQRKEAEELAAQIYRIEEARKKAASAAKTAHKEAQQAAKENAKAVADLEQELKQATMAGRELAEAQALAKLNKFATEKDIARVRQLAAAMYELEEAERLRSALADADPAEALRQQFESQLSALRELNEAKLLEDERYLMLKEGLEREYAEKSREINEEVFAAQSWQNELVIKALNDVEQATSNALTGLLTGAKNSTEAIQTLAAGISQELVSALVRMGMEQVKAWAMGKMAQQAAAAGYVASVSGQVAANTALASQAAFASTAAIPIVGPELAPAAAAAAAAAASSLGAPAIPAASMTLSGNRLYGGPVDAGKMYRVNEDGRPEIYKADNGQQFIIPGRRGQVIPNGGGGAAVVNVSVVVNADGSTSINTDTEGWASAGQEMGRAIRGIVNDELAKAMQAGGVIRSSFYG